HEVSGGYGLTLRGCHASAAWRDGDVAASSIIESPKGHCLGTSRAGSRLSLSGPQGPVPFVVFRSSVRRGQAGWMFRIRFFTPLVMNEEGWQHAGGELVVGDARLCFLVDLTHWGIGEYQHQWRAGISRLVQGAPSTALMTAYRGPGESAH